MKKQTKEDFTKEELAQEFIARQRKLWFWFNQQGRK